MSHRLVLVGVLILLAGFGLLVASAAGQGNASVGGAVFIGPFPIVFGSGPSGPVIAVVSAVIGGVMVGVMMLWGWRLAGRKAE